MEALEILEKYGIEGVVKGDEFLTLCPFHNDTNPSCSINLEKEVFNCLSCEAKGSLISFIARSMKVSGETIKKHLVAGTDTPTTLDTELILNWHKNLLVSEIHVARFKAKGLNVKTITEYLLGFDGTRYVVPIPGDDGQYINARKWKPKAKKKKWINMKGLGLVALYPIKSLDNSVIIITEGELKALLLEQLGYHSVTATGGSKSWKDEWSILFKEKTVYLCFDIDKAGKKGAEKVAKSLYRSTKEIYIVKLPLDIKKYPTGDVTDYFITEKRPKTEFNKLLKDAKKWEPFIYEETFDNNIHKVSLSNSTNAKYANCIIETKAVVSAKDMVPFLVPAHLKVKCPKDQTVCCFCSCLQQDEFKIDKKHPVILEMINVPKTRQLAALKRLLKIPAQCKTFYFDVLSSMNIEEIRLIPQITMATESTEHVVRRAFFVGAGIETNSTYLIRARVCCLPETQHATLIIFEAEPAKDNLSSFKLTLDLTLFRPKEWNVESLGKKLYEIYKDFESNVTHIFERKPLHLFYDLIYHSVLYISFQDQIIKGWVEGLVLGDSGQGKSETVVQLKNHYKLGERIDVKTSSAVGLVGGLADNCGKWMITWGTIPLNDKRLVILEELKGIPPEVIARLTEMRSTGVAEITKIEKARTNARVRLICISNPRTDRQVLTYNYGIEAIKELIGSPEDVRRFDLAIILTVKDVDPKYINMPLSSRESVKHVYTNNLCQHLILWGWSRKTSEVIFMPDAIIEVLKVASEMGLAYTSKIPIVESADQRLKVARLSAALAVRTFSTEDGKSVIVRKCHVEYISKFLNKIYSSRAFGYLDYSNLIKREQNIVDEKEVSKELEKLPFAKSVVETFLNSRSFGPHDISDWTELDVEQCRKVIGVLVRNNAIKRYKRGYVKNQSFIGLLKNMQLKGLKNETRHAKSLNEDF